jgi:hypothetical protein
MVAIGNRRLLRLTEARLSMLFAALWVDRHLAD